MDTSSRNEGNSSSGWSQAFREAGPYLNLGLQLAITMVVAVAGGYLLDQWLGSLPWLTVVGAVLGMVSVFVQLYRVSVELGQPGRSARADERNSDFTSTPEN